MWQQTVSPASQSHWNVSCWCHIPPHPPPTPTHRAGGVSNSVGLHGYRWETNWRKSLHEVSESPEQLQFSSHRGAPKYCIFPRWVFWGLWWRVLSNILVQISRRCFIDPSLSPAPLKAIVRHLEKYAFSLSHQDLDEMRSQQLISLA